MYSAASGLSVGLIGRPVGTSECFQNQFTLTSFFSLTFPALWHCKFSFLCHHCNVGKPWIYATFANCMVWVLTCSLHTPWRWTWYRGSNWCQTAQTPLTCPFVEYQHHMGLSGHELSQRTSHSTQVPFQLLAQPWSHPAISPSASLRRRARPPHFQAHWSPWGGSALFMSFSHMVSLARRLTVSISVPVTHFKTSGLLWLPFTVVVASHQTNLDHVVAKGRGTIRNEWSGRVFEDKLALTCCRLSIPRIWHRFLRWTWLSGYWPSKRSPKTWSVRLGFYAGNSFFRTRWLVWGSSTPAGW